MAHGLCSVCPTYLLSLIRSHRDEICVLRSSSVITWFCPCSPKCLSTDRKLDNGFPKFTYFYFHDMAKRSLNWLPLGQMNRSLLNNSLLNNCKLIYEYTYWCGDVFGLNYFISSTFSRIKCEHKLNPIASYLNASRKCCVVAKYCFFFLEIMLKTDLCRLPSWLCSSYCLAPLPGSLRISWPPLLRF